MAAGAFGRRKHLLETQGVPWFVNTQTQTFEADIQQTQKLIKM